MNNIAQVEQYKILHAQNADFGASSAKLIDEIALVIDYLQPKSILDFGCGKGSLVSELERRYPHINVYGYDPAVPGRETISVSRVDLVINTDVLEHIPEQALPGVVEQIAKLSDNVYFNLHHALAKKILPNGENAHCTVKPPEWYVEFMRPYFGHLTPLPGRRKHLSVLLTFSIPDCVRADYLDILERKTAEKAARRPLWKQVVRKLFGLVG